MDDAAAVLERAKALGISVTSSGNKILLEPGSKVPPDLVQAIRQHKGEILAILTSPRLVKGQPRWHAEQVARAVREEGLCIFWSEAFGEMVAFVRDDSYASRVPCGIVTYTEQELTELFRGHRSIKALRLVHEAKRRGGMVTGVESDGEKTHNGEV
ncbi:MAG: hypothetical protein JW753_00770 [Dehalococcoidia bacterium]|nr:hypothetical protein [Dehalococcoidia bacterium]